MSAPAEKPRKARLLEGVATVLSAFVGIRRRSAHDKVEVTPVQVIVTGVIAAALFVTGVITVVRIVTGK